MHLLPQCVLFTKWAVSCGFLPEVSNLDLLNRDEIFNVGHLNAAEPVLEISEAASCDLSTGKIPSPQDAPSEGEGMCSLREQNHI